MKSRKDKSRVSTSTSIKTLSSDDRNTSAKKNTEGSVYAARPIRGKNYIPVTNDGADTIFKFREAASKHIHDSHGREKSHEACLLCKISSQEYLKL